MTEMKDRRGAYRVKTLFRELNDNKAYEPVYTMYESERDGLPSARAIYVEADTEYEAAMALVNSWEHWQRLLQCKLFVEGDPTSSTGWEGLAAWRKERDERLKTEAVAALLDATREGNVNAAKALLSELSKEEKERGKSALKKQADKEEAAKDMYGAEVALFNQFKK